jgi:hypothetical protein
MGGTDQDRLSQIAEAVEAISALVYTEVNRRQARDDFYAQTNKIRRLLLELNRSEAK